MSDRLQRKHPHQEPRPRPDSSPFLPPGYPEGSKHSGSPQWTSPMAGASNKVSGSDTTFQVPPSRGSPGYAPKDVLDTATALFSAGRQQRNALGTKPSPLAVTDGAAVPGTVSTMSSLPSHRLPQEPSVRDLPHSAGSAHAGRLFSAGQGSQHTFNKDNDADTLQIRTSLLDPHPIIIPPPGSRLAFAGATSRETLHRFRSLPTLEDTLLRRAKAPLCLHNYWQYLSDIEACPEELEFWLSLADYEELYRRFNQSDNMQATAAGTPADASANRLAQTLGTAGTRLRGGRVVESGALPAITQMSQRPIDNLDKETQELDAYLAGLSYGSAMAAQNSQCHKHRECSQAYQPFTQTRPRPHSRPTLAGMGRPGPRRGMRGFFSRLFSGEPTAVSGNTGVAGAQWSNRNSVYETQDMPLLTPSTTEAKDAGAQDVPTEDDMRRSAEKLYFHYLLPGAPAELYISSQMRHEVSSRIEREGRFDPELFAPVKRHAYEAMRNESYLRFLRERFMHNITRGSAAPRAVLGLALIFVALVFQLSLIFLDVKPKGWRWLPLAGLWPGFIFTFAGVTRLDPLLAFAGRFEPVAWRLESVRDKTIRDSHLKRASMHPGLFLI
ncbi:Bud site selection protein, Revert to axial protein 1 [Coemansia sp. Benny D115]|nr:Bud site selection protein, Revert to axial protein 1 [Coemansia sp. Benny D115]